MLGVMMLIMITEADSKFIVDALKVARSDEQNYPFALTCFEVTVTCIKAESLQSMSVQRDSNQGHL